MVPVVPLAEAVADPVTGVPWYCFNLIKIFLPRKHTEKHGRIKTFIAFFRVIPCASVAI